MSLVLEPCSESRSESDGKEVMLCAVADICRSLCGVREKHDGTQLHKSVPQELDDAELPSAHSLGPWHPNGKPAALYDRIILLAPIVRMHM